MTVKQFNVIKEILISIQQFDTTEIQGYKLYSL